MRSVIATAFCILLSSLPTPTISAQSVLVVIADDLGVEKVGAYSAGAPPTPTIDSLAAGGVLFRNAWASTVCSPSRAQIHTGRHAFRTGVGEFITPCCGAPLAFSELTLPELVSSETALIGKWHLRSPSEPLAPNTTGWDHFAGLLSGAVESYYNWVRTENGVSQATQVYATSRNANDALNWIATRPGDFVCVLSFIAPHLSGQPEFYEVPPAHLHTRPPSLLLTEEGRYDAMVEAMDTELARVLAFMPANSWVIFVGDNGTPPLDGSTRVKGSPYEGGVHVPLIVSGPVVQPGREVEEVVSIVDLWSTILELRNESIPAVTHDSVSLVPYLHDPCQERLRLTVFSERFKPVPASTDFRAVRSIRWKLIRWSVSGVEEMYDLKKDSNEVMNLLPPTTNKHARVYAALSNQMALRN